MSRTSDYLVERLNSILPLARRQAALSPELQTIHREFLQSLMTRGRPLERAEIAALAPGGDATAAIWTLVANDLLVLGKGNEPVGAYPLTSEQTPHRISTSGKTVWAMCAFDALAVAPLFQHRVTIASRCPVTGAEILIEQDTRRIVTALPSADVQLGVWWRNPGAVAARNVCPGIVFLRDRAAAAHWQSGDSESREFTSLTDAIEAGATFYAPLLRGAAVGAR